MEDILTTLERTLIAKDVVAYQALADCLADCHRAGSWDGVNRVVALLRTQAGKAQAILVEWDVQA